MRDPRHDALSNLLAVIHRDGGQREQDVGSVAAALEAEAIVIALRTELSELLQKYPASASTTAPPRPYTASSA